MAESKRGKAAAKKSVPAEAGAGKPTITDPAGNNSFELERRMPVVALRGMVFFPGATMTFDVGRPESVAAVRYSMVNARPILLCAQKDAMVDEPNEEDLYSMGVISMVRQMADLTPGTFKVLCEGLFRARISNVKREDDSLMADVEIVDPEPARPEDKRLIEGMRRQLCKQFEQYALLSTMIPPELVAMAKRLTDGHELCDLIVQNITLELEEKQSQLEKLELKERMEALMEILTRELELANLNLRISRKVNENLERSQREYYLREQMKSIQDELGENEANEAEELRKRLAESGMPDDYKEKIAREIDRFSRMPDTFPETSVQRNWIELLVELPFGRKSKEKLDLKRARRILDRDHYGLKKVKERILEYIAVRALKVEGGELSIKGPILCLVGPPGVGKTSVAKSIAEALGREYVRMSLGGIHDEAEIRGHRRTYVGAMPGRIIQGIRQANTDNPLFLLDEIDKLGSDFRGDPSSALLEVLDPEQNNSFRDHYVEFPYDLSQVLFITTANSAWDIPDPLRDRMELIELSGYTDEEKKEIAKRHLLGKQVEMHGLKKNQVKLTPAALEKLISGYTSEAGVRQLDRILAQVCRRAAMMIAEQKKEKITIGEKDVLKILGRPPFHYDKPNIKDKIGTVTGLAWTYAGGDTLSIEANVVPGSGRVELTGKLGDVMKESAKAAMTYIRTRAADLGLDPEFAGKCDIHIHIPAGAVPKDGPSAGITLATALASALTGRAVRGDLAMTGEITLRGRVLPIGGLKEKSVAAKRAGIKEILIPKDNERDLEDVPETVLKNVRFTAVDNMDEVLKIALRTEVLAQTPARAGSQRSEEQEKK